MASASKLENQLCFKLYALSRQFTSLYRPLLEKLKITYPQYLVLLVLWESENVSVKMIGERLLLDSGTLTPLLKRLEKRGLIIRARSDVDERSTIITLTAEGRSMQATASCIPEDLNKTLGLEKEEYFKLNTKLNELLNQFNK